LLNQITDHITAQLFWLGGMGQSKREALRKNPEAKQAAILELTRLRTQGRYLREKEIAQTI